MSALATINASEMTRWGGTLGESAASAAGEGSGGAPPAPPAAVDPLSAAAASAPSRFPVDAAVNGKLVLW